MDATVGAVSKVAKAGKRDCQDVDAPTFCPKQTFRLALTDPADKDPISAFFVDGRLYLLARDVVSLPSWHTADRDAYLAAFDALVLGRLPGGNVKHDTSLYYKSRITYPAAEISLELGMSGLAKVHLFLTGKSQARADALVRVEEKRQEAAAERRQKAADRVMCRCKNATIGSRWPVRSGHAARGPDDGRWQVIAVDPAHCQATVKDTIMGGEDSWSCTQFVFPRVNPAGALEVAHPALACGDILGP
jgi:hypothetical protein